ncbi:ABC transporter permease [Oceanirhabdus sp. W0125-5]|uniref:ABC transporter permease n=1 Tax=Oceanirhabdus sp. W0125-5 TaxID=2999116 RepID=UPI0022F2F0DE|nr:ABC transporter permease [Oceanirhabdus sp. W0125-5]WBW97192.1 ABC transporter permease [Oceanirhabdus sp. W0125-5]
MFNLLKLELKRFNIKNKIKIGTICNLSIFVLLCLIFFIDNVEGKIVFKDYNELFSVITTFTNVTFMIYASVLISELIISEYKNKTITLLFTYPVNRKKLLISKLIIIGIFTFISIIISTILLFISFYIVQLITNSTLGQLTYKMQIAQLGTLTVSALTNSAISMIPLYFGMRKKSTVATILSAVLLSGFLYSNNGGFTISSIIIIPIAMMLVGLFVAYMALRNIENKDVIV